MGWAAEFQYLAPHNKSFLNHTGVVNIYENTLQVGRRDMPSQSYPVLYTLRGFHDEEIWFPHRQQPTWASLGWAKIPRHYIVIPYWSNDFGGYLPHFGLLDEDYWWIVFIDELSEGASFNPCPKASDIPRDEIHDWVVFWWWGWGS